MNSRLLILVLATSFATFTPSFMVTNAVFACGACDEELESPKKPSKKKAKKKQSKFDFYKSCSKRIAKTDKAKAKQINKDNLNRKKAEKARDRAKKDLEHDQKTLKHLKKHKVALKKVKTFAKNSDATKHNKEVNETNSDIKNYETQIKGDKKRLQDNTKLERNLDARLRKACGRYKP